MVDLPLRSWPRQDGPGTAATPARPLRIVDFNNMFSFTGGGIRTYHLGKLEHFADSREVEYTLLAPSDRDGVERVGRSRLVHLRAPRIPGAPDYRMLLDPFKLRRVLEALRPDLVEVGGAYVDPWLMRHAGRSLDTVVVGFWHTHYPDVYFRTLGERLSPRLGALLQRAGWALARSTYARYDATIAAADCVVDDLRVQGIERVIQCPLGVDVELFHPRRRDPELRRRVGASDRPLVFFPHRLLQEKGLHLVLAALPEIARRTGAVFAFAGVGPELPRVRALAAERDDCHCLGYIDGPAEMARWYASSDLVYGLSAWETFGLSVIEAMASGVPVVGADGGATRDWITRARCGLTVPRTVDAVREATVALLFRPDRDILGRRGRRFVTRHFSWPATFARLLAVYRELVAARRAGRALTGFPYRLPSAGVDAEHELLALELPAVAGEGVTA